MNERGPPAAAWMNASGRISDELERQLADLHEASYGWACSCCDWNEADAEDVLQTAYMRVISGRARYEGHSTFRTWFFGVIRNTAREGRRRATAREGGVERLSAELDVSGGIHEAEDPVEMSERAAALHDGLESLPGRQREVLHLVFYQDLTVQEAAEVLEVSIGSARVHYDRGKKKLRALLSSMESGGIL
jgi:RNA polymerase sigma factor (sigma-70 family)